ncbi:MAG: ATP-binding protein [Desulfuromonadales bacterium]
MNTEMLDREFLQHLTILFVEDEEITFEMSTEYLSRFCGLLLTARNGAEGLEVYRTKQPDIIITDIHMPVMDGLTMAAEIRTLDRSIPIILLTAFEQASYLKRAIDIGVDKYVTKPLDITCFFRTLLDCVQRLRIKHELQESEERFRQMFRNSPDPQILVCDGVFVDCNRATEQLWQCDRQEICGRRPEDFSPRYQPDGRLSSESAVEIFAKVHCSGTHTFEWLHQRRDGSQFWGDVSLVTFEMQGRQVIYSSLRDISVQKQLEQEQQRQAEELRAYYQKLQEQELFTHSTLDGLGAHICVIDRQGEIILTNRSWDGFAVENGAAPGSCGVGTNYLAVCIKSCGEDDTDYVHFFDAIAAVISGTKSGHRMEYPCHSPTEQRWFLCTISPFTVAGVRYAVISHENITALKQIEAELIENEKQLHSFNDRLEIRIAEEVGKNREKDILLLHQDKMSSIGQLAAGVAHEINNPMAFIASNLVTLNGYVESLSEFHRLFQDLLEKNGTVQELVVLEEATTKLDIAFILEDISPLIAESSEGATRVKQIVHDLKGFARTDDSSFELADLNDCVRSTVNLVRNEIKYVAELDLQLGDIPQISCSSNQLSQVIINLLVNAAHSIDSHGSITVTTRQVDDTVVLSVRDTGKGMTEEVRKRIFEPFYTTKGVGKGTGLGLSISYSIIKKHGGEISVESEPGKGTIFSVTLPIHERQEDPA